MLRLVRARAAPALVTNFKFHRDPLVSDFLTFSHCQVRCTTGPHKGCCSRCCATRLAYDGRHHTSAEGPSVPLRNPDENYHSCLRNGSPAMTPNRRLRVHTVSESESSEIRVEQCARFDSDPRPPAPRAAEVISGRTCEIADSDKQW